MAIGATISLVVIVGGFIAARAFRLRRFDRDSDRRREQRELDRRRHHFRGSLEMELVKEPDQIADPNPT